MHSTDVKIMGKTYKFFRPLAGKNDNKFNRALKIAKMFNSLDAKLVSMIHRGNGDTDTARCALALRMMMHTGMRIGNEASAEGYTTKPHPNSKKEPKFVQTYGLTTLKPAHILTKGSKVYLNFVGKRQMENSFVVSGELAKSVINLLEKRQSEETLFGISSRMLSKFVRKYVGQQFMPKDFRTLRANMEAWHTLSGILRRPNPKRKTEFNNEVKEIAGHVSICLSNTIGVCKKSYIDDLLFDFHFSQRWGA
jgi:DNA topoisomerase-1